MSKNVTPHTNSMPLLLVKAKKTSKWLHALQDEPVVFELTDGTVYSGRIDDHEAGMVWLYDAMVLAEKTWCPVKESMPGFYTTGIKRVLMPDENWLMAGTMKELFGSEPQTRPELDIDDVRKVYIDNKFQPPRGIVCKWDNGSHSPGCDTKLHEALSTIATNAFGNKGKDETKWNSAFKLVRDSLILSGARIP